MRRRVRRVGRQGLAKSLAVDQGVVKAEKPHVAHDLRQIIIYWLIGKQPRVQFNAALSDARSRPVSSHDFHAETKYSFTSSLEGTPVYRLRATGGTAAAAAGRNNRVLQFLELQFEPALDAPRFTHVARNAICNG